MMIMLFYDEFDVLENHWDVSTLKEAYINNNSQLYTDASGSDMSGATFNDIINNSCAVYNLNYPISCNFDVETEIYYTRTASFYRIYLALQYEFGHLFMGMYGKELNSRGGFHCNVAWTGSNSRPWSGDVKYNIIRNQNNIHFVENDIILYTLENFNYPITSIKLVNATKDSYGGKEVYWKYVKFSKETVKINLMNYNIIDS